MDETLTGDGQGGDRPGVLENISETQMQELERQFNEDDQEGWKALTQSYAWSSDQSQEVWTWFGQRPAKSAQG